MKPPRMRPQGRVSALLSITAGVATLLLGLCAVPVDGAALLAAGRLATDDSDPLLGVIVTLLERATAASLPRLSRSGVVGNTLSTSSVVAGAATPELPSRVVPGPLQSAGSAVASSVTTVGGLVASGRSAVAKFIEGPPLSAAASEGLAENEDDDSHRLIDSGGIYAIVVLGVVITAFVFATEHFGLLGNNAPMWGFCLFLLGEILILHFVGMLDQVLGRLVYLGILGFSAVFFSLAVGMTLWNLVKQNLKRIQQRIHRLAHILSGRGLLDRIHRMKKKVSANIDHLDEEVGSKSPTYGRPCC